MLITGASSGLGAGMARHYGMAGHQLVLCARRVERLEEIKADLEGAGAGSAVLLKRLDVTDQAQVFTVFGEAADALGGLDRIIVNAGIGKGAPIGTGHFEANRETVTTNALGALAQCEAAMELFRAVGRGHLVVIASVSAVRGARAYMTTYAATKAFVASLAEGIRSDVMGSRIRVTTILPGYIESEMTARARRTPYLVDNATGVNAIVSAIDREPDQAIVPWWPWRPIAAAMRIMPLRVVRRLM
jgi:short-subunit dehydrogenase